LGIEQNSRFPGSAIAAQGLTVNQSLGF